MDMLGISNTADSSWKKVEDIWSNQKKVEA